MKRVKGPDETDVASAVGAAEALVTSCGSQAKPDLHNAPRRQRMPNSNQRRRVMIEYILVIGLIALAGFTEYDKWTRRCGPATESHKAGVD